jgi:hypothetical protein
MFESVQKRAAMIARDGLKVRRLVVSCKKLLSERGEAAGVSLAKITLDLYRDLDDKEQARSFAALLTEFSPDPDGCSRRRRRMPRRVGCNLSQLSIAVEPPRQELLRRLNRAPGGTATILRMRERLLELKTPTDRARRRRPGLPAPAVVVVQPRLPADRSSRLAHARLPAGTDHRCTKRCTRFAAGTTSRAAGGRRPVLCVLPSRAAGRAADLPRGGV